MGFIAQNEGPSLGGGGGGGGGVPALHPFWTPSAVQLQCNICGTQTLSNVKYYFTENNTTKCSSQDGNRK